MDVDMSWKLLSMLLLQKPIDHEALKIMKELNLAGEATITLGVLQILPTENESDGLLAEQIIRLLLMLGRHQCKSFREALASYRISRVLRLVEKMQGDLLTKLNCRQSGMAATKVFWVLAVP